MRRRRRKRPVPTRFDPFVDDPDLRYAYSSLVGGAWEELEYALDSYPDAWLMSSILTSDDAAVETITFERYHAARRSARSLAMLGGAQVRDAWDLVTDLDQGIDRAGLALVDGRFRAQLATAERTLHEAVRLGPASADPWVHLLSSGRGLGLDLNELRTRFENAHSRVPFRPDACRQYVLGLSSRGGGADTAMFDFVRWLELEAPAGSPARMALPMAHLEYGLGDRSGSSLTEHLSRPETVAELAPALASFLHATPTEASPAELLVLNAYALAITISGTETARLARECLRRIDNRPTSYPWSLYRDEEITAVFAEVQRSQLRAIERYL